MSKCLIKSGVMENIAGPGVAIVLRSTSAIMYDPSKFLQLSDSHA